MSARERILSLLDAHEPLDSEEAKDAERLRRFVEATAEPMDRGNEHGHVVASGLVADPSLEQIVLLHHCQLDMWLQPGGHAEPGETGPSQVASREAREETGLEVHEHPAAEGLVDVDVHAIPASDEMPEHWHYDLRFLLVADPDREPEVPEAEGHEVRWFAIEQALAELELDDGLRRLVGKVRKL